MKVAQNCLALTFALCVIGAIYLSVRDIALPEPSRIDSTITEGQPLQAVSDQRVFTAIIKGYTYTITPRATYDIAGLVVSQHRGDALFNMYHKADPGNIEDVCVVWGDAIANGSSRSRRSNVRVVHEPRLARCTRSGLVCSPAHRIAVLTGRKRSRRLDQPIQDSPSAKPQKEAYGQAQHQRKDP
jgi:hypothetical protein